MDTCTVDWCKRHCSPTSDIQSTRYRRYGRKDAFGSLNQYGMGRLPDKKVNPSVVYGTWLENGEPRYYAARSTSSDEESKQEDQTTYQELIQEFFDVANVNVIVTGHQPIGDHPLPIQLSKEAVKTKKLILCGDSSFSGDTIWLEGVEKGEETGTRINKGRGQALSGRGDFAVSEILLEQSSTSDDRIAKVKVHGVLSDGTSYESYNDIEEEDNEGMNNLIGTPATCSNFVLSSSAQRLLEDGIQWFVKSKFTNGSYLLSAAKGYEVFNTIAERKTELSR